MANTAMQQLIEDMQELEATDNPIYNRAKELLSMEREQIEEAWKDGVTGTLMAPDYYNSKYGGEE